MIGLKYAATMADSRICLRLTNKPAFFDDSSGGVLVSMSLYVVGPMFVGTSGMTE